ncbi:MAG: cryptochrome/photolyase family protein [Chitinophagales bacterium]
MTKIGLLFPHQLFKAHEILQNCDLIYLVEEYLFFNQFKFHQQKLAFHRASMKAFEAHLVEQNITVQYVSSHEKYNDIRKLIPFIIEEYHPKELHFIDPTDEWLINRIKSSAKHLKLVTYENPLFINSRKDLDSFFRKDKKSFFQTKFYKQQRKNLNILIDEDENPEGGKWTYDGDNRKKYPKGKTPPNVYFPSTNKYWEEAMNYVEKYFDKNPGQLTEDPLYPIHHQAAQEWLQQFLDFRFHHFGDYEDAIVKKESILHHSILSPLMNVGLLLPIDVLDQALDYAKSNAIAINSTEGFVRQIIGWREFIRGMYECKGNYSRTQNYWGFDRKIPSSFYDGTTGIAPIDATIKKVLATGYCHHIERLMILGNFMLLCEFDPDDVYQWFMELFIDAYDWVMVPNIYGMSQFADGGLFATKPYISGSNYLNKMSDYPKGEWQAVWDGLFWRFMHEHESFFKKNPRTAMLLSTYDKMPDEKKNTHLKNAEQFLKKLDE